MAFAVLYNPQLHASSVLWINLEGAILVLKSVPFIKNTKVPN